MNQYQPVNWTKLTNLVDAFHGHPGQPPVNYELFSELSTPQARRLQGELEKPENTPNNPDCDVNALMKKIRFEEPE